MMHRMSVLAFIAIVVLLSLPLWVQGDEGTDNPQRWQDRMQALADVMGELLPELASRNGDIAIIEKNAEKLADLSHSLSEGGGDKALLPPPDADPSIALLAGRFEHETRRAYQTIQFGDVDYGKDLLRTATSYCIACHTRHDQGPDLPTLTLNPRVESLSRSEKAGLFAATLQFDKALAEFQALVADDVTAQAHPLEWERAVHHALAIAVRVKKSPDLAEEIVRRVLEQPAAPEFMKRNASRWQESISRWKAEPQRKELTERGLFAEMKRLLNEARHMQSYSADRAADILYLRTSATAHDLLRMAPDGVHAAEAIYVAGVANEVLNDPVLWPIHEIYYEACIRKLPHTKMAEECYRRYEEAIYFGYSGSGGTFIPDDVRATLAQLKRLARNGKRTKK